MEKHRTSRELNDQCTKGSSGCGVLAEALESGAAGVDATAAVMCCSRCTVDAALAGQDLRELTTCQDWSGVPAW